MDLIDRFKGLRDKALIKKYDGKLNEEQLKAVLNTDGPMLVLAGAGSGKTRVLTFRIAHLIKYGNIYNSDFIPDNILEEDIEKLNRYIKDPKNNEMSQTVDDILSYKRVSPYSILAITFTNKAANEMKERVTDLVGDKAENMWVSTFHSACVRILRNDIEKIGYKRNFVIYDYSDQKTLIKDCISELNYNDKEFPPKNVLSIISSAKNELIDCTSFRKKNEGEYRLSRIANIYELYQKKLKSNNALDFDDLIMLAVKLLKEHKSVLNYYQTKFKYILVDEYQDTNSSQYVLVSLLSKKHKNICVVGDDDQSIYKFRGANIRNILNFEKDFKDAVCIKLERNYRSTQHILNAANSVIKNNSGRKGKNLWTDKISNECITMINAENEYDEAEKIADIIQDLVENENYNYSSFAILYRVNAQSRVLEQIFLERAVPYRVLAGLRFFDRKEIKDITAYLRLINNPSDDISLKRIINEPKKGIGKKTLEKAELIAAERDLSMFQIISASDNIEALNRSSSKLKTFVRIINELNAKKDSASITEITKLMLDKTGYMEALEKDNSSKAISRIENIKEFISFTTEFEKENEDKTLESFLENVTLISDIDNYDEDEEAVVLMTLHSAKGLEFPVVFLCGMEEGMFPSFRSLSEEEEVEEERRLCYVGITRAQERLYLSHADTRRVYGKSEFFKISRFANEIPKEYLKIYNEEKDDRTTNFIDKGVKKTNELDIQKKRNRINNRGLNIDYEVGDMVTHRKFGKGMVLSVNRIGNDAKVEVAFESVGTKNLMAVFAKLKKL